MNQMGVHLFFLLLPAWAIATLIYLLVARMLGAATPASEASRADSSRSEQRQQEEREFLQALDLTRQTGVRVKLNGMTTLAKWIALASLTGCLIMSLACFTGDLSLASFRATLLWPSLAYFVSATYWMIGREQADESLLPGTGDTPG